MNFLSLPRRGLSTHGGAYTYIQNQNSLLKGSFISASRQMAAQSCKFLPLASSYQHSSALIMFPEQLNNRKRNQFQQLKQTLSQFKKSLQQAKYGQQRNITQKTQISYVIQSLFSYLKEIMKSSHNIENFDWIFTNYIYVLKRKENSQHFFTQVQGHLKEILGGFQAVKYKKNRKIYMFLSRLFPYCSHTVYKILQNKSQIFDNQSSQALQVYKSFIEFAAQKSNNSLLLSYIKNQLSKDSLSIQKLIILLSNYKVKLTLEIIQDIERKIDELVVNFVKYWKETPGMERQLIELINQFLSMDWPVEGRKFTIVIKYVNHWNKDLNLETEKHVNKFLRNMPSLIDTKAIVEEIKDVIYGYIMNRIYLINSKVQKSTQSRKAHNKDFNQTFIFLNILFEKCGRILIESIIQKSLFKKTVQNLILQPFPLKDGLIGMLSTLKKLNIHELGNQIQTLLIDKMKTILSVQKGSDTRMYSQIYRKQLKKMQINAAQNKTVDDLYYCIKALRYFSFNYQSFWNIYSMIKRYIFKKKIINQYGFEFKKQVVKACLYIISKLSKPQQCKNILTDAIDIIGQDQQLKTLYIQWSGQDDQFYNKKLFQIYNSTEYLQNLIHDYSSKNISIKRFSIKILCLLYPYNQCQIIPFLKKTYYQIYQRLSVDDLVDLNEKKIGLKLIREIIKSRPQIVKDDSQQFASFLYTQLCQIIKYNYHHHTHSLEHNQLIIQILKTLIQMTKIMRESILPYVRSLGFHLVSLINSKVTSSEIKRYCLQTFNEMAFNCGYVILPYFYHRNLLMVFREILKSDDRNHVYRNQLMRFMGSLGYVSKEKFYRLKKLTDNVQQGGLCTPECYALVEYHFQKTFKEISYLKQVKPAQRPVRQMKQSRYIFRRQSVQIKQGKQGKQSKQSKQSKQQRQTLRQTLRQTRFSGQYKQTSSSTLRKIVQIKPIPPTSPYYCQQKVNYKTSKQNFNYKKMIIENVLQNMNQQSSSIIFYNTFRTLEAFIFILPRSQEKMYQSLIFDKMLVNCRRSDQQQLGERRKECETGTKQPSISSQQSYPLNNMLSLLVKIIFYQDFKQHINELFNFFTTHLNNQQKRTLVFQCLYVLTSKNTELIQMDVKVFLLKIRKIVLEMYKSMDGSRKKDSASHSAIEDEVQHHIKLCFGILTNLSKYLDNYLHLFLPDFNTLFIKRPEKICQTYFSLLLNLFQNCPSTEQFLSQIYDHLYDLLRKELENLDNNNNKTKAPQQSFSKQARPSTISTKTLSIGFVNNIIDFLISILLIFGDKFKNFSQNFHNLYKSSKYKSHPFYSIVEDFMKKNSSFNNLHYEYQSNELTEIMKFQTMFIPLRTRQDSIIKNVYTHESLLNFAMLNEMIQNFNCDQNEIQEQSEEWFVMLSISVFEKAEDPFIRACSPIVKEDKTLCNDLFPLAFYFFWNVLNNDFRRKLTMKLKNILDNKGISLRVKQKFIDTIYFMEQQQFPIPIADKILRDASQEVLDLAKSLFYMEKLFLDDHEVYGQNLIKMYAQMGQSQSAVGLLGIVQNLTTKAKIQLYQKLNRYREALRQHENLKDKTKFQNIQLQIKIRKDMFQWDSVLNRVQKLQKYKSKLSHYAVESAINLGKWDHVKKHLPNVDQNHEKSNLWRAMLSIYEKKYDEVEKYIRKDRELIYPKICQLFNFSYERKMQGIIRLQTLTELEEANQYLKFQKLTLLSSEEQRKKTQHITSKKKALIDSVWNDRIQGANTNLWSLQQLLLSRSLLFTKCEDIDNWINYCKLALKENQPELCKKTLETLSNQLRDPKYAFILKEQKDKKKNQFIIETLLVECKFLLGDLRDQDAVAQIQKLIDEKGTSGSHHEYFYRCAMWLSEKQYDFTLEKAKKSISLLNNAVKDFKTYIKGWHLLGLMHNKIIEMHQTRKKPTPLGALLNKPSERRMSIVQGNSRQIDESQISYLNTTRIQKDKDSRDNDSRQIIKEKEKDSRELHISQALKCFIQSVSCGVKNHQFFLEDCLKIMNIIFTQNEAQGVLNDLLEEYKTIPAQGLIQIIPQIVGRLDISDKPQLLDMMKKLLIHIGIAHPQAILFPLIFCKKSGNLTKKKAAQEIFAQLSKLQKQQKDRYQKQQRQPYDSNDSTSQILKDAQKIAQQLIKVSLKLNQKFYINVNKIYQSSKNKGVCSKSIAESYFTFIQKMLREQSSGLSISELGFIQQYRQQLRDINKKLLIYKNSGENQFFKKAEIQISLILSEIRKSLQQTKKVFLEQVSPELYNMRSSKVCLFGQYNLNSQQIYISGFKNQLTVVTSKQRPKKVILTGSNQKNYNFLLKGKQDLRLDERIMQLFSLINKMFHDPSERQNYSIKGYSITPISMEIGIISWVQNCDTIGQLILKGRSSANKYLQKEISKEICQFYHILPRAQKVEIYKEIQQKVSGTDLRNIFWTRSSSSEEWLKSRTCYIRSLAVMSIVGYIIGLGDRHPHNIMIQRDSGQVVHIDFGDCFDVNKMRKEYPQRVPFRLTRMLVKAMQPCGVHGIFKQTCEKIIKLLRNNKQSIIAIVQAFKYDPLIGWRLVKKEQGNQDQGMLEHSFQDNDVSYLTRPGEKIFGEEKQKRQQRKQSKNIDFALHILNEIKKKLNGKLFVDSTKIMTPEEQVEKLINEAISPQNLVEHYEGWQIYW